MFALLLALLTQTASEPGSGSTFTTGAVCHDVNLNLTMAASEMLRGKHLVVNELDWAPFAKKKTENGNASWAGIDMDILDRLSALLGFTYEIRLMDARTKGESWSDLLVRDSPNADLTASYWTHSVERFDKVKMLKGHLDLAATLLARVSGAAESKLSVWYRSFYSFLSPFRFDLWLALLFLVVLSALVDFLIERLRVPETTINASLYEYFAGILWGGFEYPLSRASAIYQVMLGFFFVIFISSCERREIDPICLSRDPPS